MTTKTIDLKPGDVVPWGDQTHTVQEIVITSTHDADNAERFGGCAGTDCGDLIGIIVLRPPTGDDHTAGLFCGQHVEACAVTQTAVSNLAVGDVLRLVSGKLATITADEGTTRGLRRLLLDLEGCTTSVLWRATHDVEIVATADQFAPERSHPPAAQPSGPPGIN